MAELKTVGRFAPTPSGRMHLGNVFAALIAWLSVRSKGGEMVLRMEDLDTQRTSEEYAQILREDLRWLGLDYDRETPPQSARSAVYDRYFDKLAEMGLLNPCYCTRSQLHSVNAPHLSDGTYVYPGTCRNLTEAQRATFHRAPAWRVRVPDRVWTVEDRVQGHYECNLATDCGDMVVRRADGVVMLCPNYNDALSANLTAFINRLTALFRQTRFYDKALFALVVSGYSGSDLVARQLISAMNMNKSFYLPGRFALLETANDPGEAMGLPGVRDRLDRFADHMLEVLARRA